MDRTCSRCPVEFESNSQHRTYEKYLCPQCKVAYFSAYRAANRDRINEQNRQRYALKAK